MKQRNILILALVAVVLVIAGVVASQKNGSEKQLANGGPLVPDLRGTVDKVEDIRIVTRNGDAVTQVSLRKKADVWQVADRNYRVDAQKLATLFNTLAQARRVEPKTSKPENYGKLNVRNPTNDKGEGSGTLLRLLSSDGSPHLELIVGAAAQGRKGQYVRIANDTQAWLTDQALPLPPTSADWLDRNIVDITPQDILAIDFGTLTLKRAAADKPLELAAIPQGRELTYEGVTAAAASTLSQLQLKDVLAADSIALDQPAAITAFTTAKASITVKAYHQNDKSYLTLSAAGVDDADDAAHKQVDTWNAGWQPWVFEVETVTYNKFVKSINDFTKEIAKTAKAP